MAAGPQAPAAQRGARTAPTRPQGQGILLRFISSTSTKAPTFFSVFASRLGSAFVVFLSRVRVFAFLDGFGSFLCRVLTVLCVSVFLFVRSGVDLVVCCSVCFECVMVAVATVLFLGSCVFFPFFVS